MFIIAIERNILYLRHTAASACYFTCINIVPKNINLIEINVITGLTTRTLMEPI